MFKMEGWKYWMDKKIFLILKNKRTYSGTVIDVDDTSATPLIWITITDKFGKRVTFVHSEIDTIQEEGK